MLHKFFGKSDKFITCYMTIGAFLIINKNS